MSYICIVAKSRDAFHSLLELFFPNPCLGCGKRLGANPNPICLKCEFSLPKNMFFGIDKNPIKEKFNGIVPIEFATAYLSFGKKTNVQTLMHALKYRNATDLGVFLGQMLGIQIKSVMTFDEHHCLIPVPLHPKKLLKRGYNQSLLIAEGVSEILNIPVIDDAIIRSKFSETQTKKRRFDRFENVSELFKVVKPEIIQNKKIILIDDIITTGATVAACANSLLTSVNASVGVIALASTEN